MHEEIRSLPCEPLKKLARTDLTVSKAFELPHHPYQHRLIDMPEQRVQLRWSVSPVVPYPTPQEWIEPPGNLVQRQQRLTAEIQIPNRLPHGFHRRRANRWIETAKQYVIPTAFDQTGPEAVSKKVKLDILKLAPTLSIFAVNDLGFCRMHFQTTLCESGLKFGFKSFCFLLASAVNQSIVGISTPREIWVGPRHPEIERVVKESVRQNRADYTP